MVVSPVVEAVESDGRRLLAGLSANGVEVTAAGWVQATGDDRPYLYIATPLVNYGPFTPVYERIDRRIVQMQPCHVGPFDTRLVPTDHPVAAAMATYLRRYAGEPIDSTVYSDNLLGVEVRPPVFIYALPAPAPVA